MRLYFASTRISNMWKRMFRLAVGLFLFGNFWFSTGTANATSSPKLLYPQSKRFDLSDPNRVKAFVDTFFQEQMKERHIPGAVFVLVKDGNIMMAQGYGYANLAQQTPIDPSTTVFRVQSISKLFTATAVMQLVERGQLDLKADVNTYLRDFQITRNFPQPVTTAELLTHTAGFDLVATGVSAPSIDKQQSLGAYLTRTMPGRIMPPGVIYSYNNHAISLAGYLVEEVSGKPFAQYIQNNILEPLDMQHSSFVLRPDLVHHMATEYYYRGGTYQPVAFDYLNTLPAGGLNATGTDMAHFMIAHLQNGQYLNRRILRESTAQEMHRQHFTASPRLPGMAYGFHEYFQNGLRALEHGGTWAGSASELVLFPDLNMGFFMSYTRNDEGLRDRFTKDFIDAFLPSPQTKPPSESSPATQAHNTGFVGSYRSVSFIRTDFFKLGALLYEYQVTTEPDGTLVLHYPSSKSPTRWLEIEPLLFQRITETEDLESDLAAFQVNQAGGIKYLFIGTGNPLIKLAWYETSAVQEILVLGLLITFVSGCMAYPLGSLLRRLRRKPETVSSPVRWSRWLAGIYSCLACLLLIGLAVALMTIDPNEFNFGIPASIKILLSIPWILLIMTPVLLLVAGLIWKGGDRSLGERLHNSLLALAALLLIPFLHYWNLLVWPQ